MGTYVKVFLSENRKVNSYHLSVEAERLLIAGRRRLSSAFRLLSSVICLLFIICATAAGGTSDTENLLQKMTAAYERVTDYQARLEVRTYKKDGSFKTKIILYSFKKPNRIRLDFESPLAGMVFLYPDKKGKGVLYRPGWADLFKLRLQPDSFLLQVAPGQRIDQTDLGLLIANIARSFTDPRSEHVEVIVGKDVISTSVLAENHFRADVMTRYIFVIDTKRWLPVKVEEWAIDGFLERTVSFSNLRTNIGLADSVFSPD